MPVTDMNRAVLVVPRPLGGEGWVGRGVGGEDGGALERVQLTRGRTGGKGFFELL